MRAQPDAWWHYPALLGLLALAGAGVVGGSCWARRGDEQLAVTAAEQLGLRDVELGPLRRSGATLGCGLEDVGYPAEATSPAEGARVRVVICCSIRRPFHEDERACSVRGRR